MPAGEVTDHVRPSLLPSFPKKRDSMWKEASNIWGTRTSRKGQRAPVAAPARPRCSRVSSENATLRVKPFNSIAPFCTFLGLFYCKERRYFSAESRWKRENAWDYGVLLKVSLKCPGRLVLNNSGWGVPATIGAIRSRTKCAQWARAIRSRAKDERPSPPTQSDEEGATDRYSQSGNWPSGLGRAQINKKEGAAQNASHTKSTAKARRQRPLMATTMKQKRDKGGSN